MSHQDYQDFTTRVLTRELAEHYVSELAQMANQIPEVIYSPDDILTEQKGARLLFNKWAHSLIMLDGDKPIGFVMMKSTLRCSTLS